MTVSHGRSDDMRAEPRPSVRTRNRVKRLSPLLTYPSRPSRGSLRPVPPAAPAHSPAVREENPRCRGRRPAAPRPDQPQRTATAWREAATEVSAVVP